MDCNTSLSDSVFCHCKPYALNAACRVVKKNGPNFGKAFFCCQKPSGRGCKFFRFAEENEVPMSTANRERQPTKRKLEYDNDEIEEGQVQEAPAKKNKIEVNNASLDPTSKSYREMACELLYKRLENQEEVMKRSQEVSLEIARLLKEATENLKEFGKAVTAIRIINDPEEDEADKEVIKILEKVKDKK